MNTVRLPFIKSERGAFGALFLAGFLVCTGLGMNQAAIRGWLHPVSIFGYIAGTLALLLGASVLFRVRIGPIQNDRAALKALLGVIALKVVASLFYGLI